MVKQKKLEIVMERVKQEVVEAKKKLKDTLLSYQQMIVDNKKQTTKCIKMIAEDLDTFQGLKKIYKRYMMACHTLLYIKDSMEEAVETYEDSAKFMKEVLRGGEKYETVHNIHWRYQELMKLRKEIGEDAKEEAEKHATLVKDLIDRHEEFYKEASLLHIKGKELDTALRDLDRRISKEEQFMYAAHSWNERAWRHYSFINFTLFDIMKYLIRAKNLNPKQLEGSLWEKIQFIRREHMYNLEILKRSDNKNVTIDLYKNITWKNAPKFATERDKILNKKLKEIRKKFKGDVPKIFKILFKKLKVPHEESIKSGKELLKLICPPKVAVCHDPCCFK
ncbi:uncharacterized protein [Halyomorpha halys]|nr:uncharacterized protein LOC106685209 isoform X2 [Halyomorpha halys]